MQLRWLIGLQKEIIRNNPVPMRLVAQSDSVEDDVVKRESFIERSTECSLA
jgi:hypothetical protein